MDPLRGSPAEPSNWPSWAGVGSGVRCDPPAKSSIRSMKSMAFHGHSLKIWLKNEGNKLNKSTFFSMCLIKDLGTSICLGSLIFGQTPTSACCKCKLVHEFDASAWFQDILSHSSGIWHFSSHAIRRSPWPVNPMEPHPLLGCHGGRCNALSLFSVTPPGPRICDPSRLYI